MDSLLDRKFRQAGPGKALWKLRGKAEVQVDVHTF